MIKKLSFLLALVLFTSILFASPTVKITFTLGKSTVFNGKTIQSVQLNQVLSDQDFIRIPKGSALTLMVGVLQIKIKGENKFKVKELIDNINHYEKFLDFSSKRKEISDKIIYRAQPSPNLGIRAEEEKENQNLNWSDDISEKPKLKTNQTIDPTSRLKEYYIKGEYEGVVLYLKENPKNIETIKKTEASFYVGASFYAFGGYSECIEFFESYLKLSSKTIALERAALYFISSAYFTTHQYKKALITLSAFIKEHNSAAEPEVYLLLAKTYQALGQLKEKDHIVKEMEGKFSEQILESFKEELLELKSK